MKKTLTALLLFVLPLLALSAGTGAYDNYIRKYSKVAVSEMRRTGVPASITLAQGLLESAAGQSYLAVEGNNHFGIKCHNNWKGKEIHKDAEVRDECFRAYSNAEASFRDHSDFLRFQNRYKSLFNLKPTDYKRWAVGLQKAGYATDPKYSEKLIKIIEDYKLYRYDGGVEVEIESPTVAEAPKKIEIKYMEKINISLSRQAFEQNGVPFVYAVEGERYEDLAAVNNLFTKEILRFNDASADRPLKGGEPVYLSAKKREAAPGVEKLVVGPGETFTLWEISQNYAVKLSSLAKLNRVSANSTFCEGDIIILRQ